MLQTNLIGRYFIGNMEKVKYRVVAVYMVSSILYIVGENERGTLIAFNVSQVQLIPTVKEEDLRGVI